MFADRCNGKIRTVRRWDTEDDLLASVPWNDAQLARFAELFTAPLWSRATSSAPR